jgi:glutamine---fructose-6-phosphate transaminase (isomerizing)
MCGIVGYIGKQNASEILIDGLRRLEYRGYDSAGVVVLKDGALSLRRSVGKLAALETLLQKEPVKGEVGIGHTRWATHGRPSEDNAHPHRDCSGRIVVVHNGIVENYAALKTELISKGHKFDSQTDTEVLAHLIEESMKSLNGAKITEEKFVAAVRDALTHVHGAYALGILCSDVPDVILGARKDCPLILGLGDGELLLASDVPAILHRTRQAIPLEDGDLAILNRQGYKVIRVDTGAPVQKKVTQITWDPVQAEKSGYRHFMLKEIHEQPRTIEDTLLGRVALDDWEIYLKNVGMSASVIKSLKRTVIVACGTSWHAGLVGKYLIEKWIQAPCEVDIASEYRYRDPLIGPDTLFICISQSGETADTLAALRYAKSKGAPTLAITNVVGSSIAREAHGKIYTHCGPEIGVASTKAFTAQLTVLYLVALYGAMARGTMDRAVAQDILDHLLQLPGFVTEALRRSKDISVMAKKFTHSRDFLFLGRHLNYPIALEGSLKLKEISYIHAEGYPAGELKHGPIALIDEDMPVVAIATQSAVYEKVLSNVEEVKARGGTVIAIATEGDERVASKADYTIFMPPMPEFLSPCVNIVPLQILAYDIAVQRGCDVDQPRNLAKSVTVE